MPTTVLDVRPMRKPDKHPAIFDAYRSLAVGESFVLVNDHNPVHLRDEFEAEHPGSYGWEYLSRETRDWQIKITKLASTPLPRVLVDTGELGGDAAGAAWRLDVRDRDLDSNVIVLPPNDGIDEHAGPDLDVLVHVIAGSGVLNTELGGLPVSAGALVFLPRRSRRGFRAGPDGLRYVTVHRRRTALVIGSA